MRTINIRTKLFISFLFISNFLSAQSSTEGGNILLISVIVLAGVLLLWAILSLANNLLKIEASKYGIDTFRNNFSVFPSTRDFFESTKTKYIKEGKLIKLTKGHDILLVGEAIGEIKSVPVNRFAIKPTDFHNMSPIPKVEPEIGDSILAGDVLFYDKKRPEIKYVSPVSGELVEVVRGEKRSIASVVVLADKENKYKSFSVPNLETISRNELVEFMLGNGLWTLINERPYDVVPDMDSIPKNIFISTFDTAPLAPCLNTVVNGKDKEFQKGLDVLGKLTTGFVHLGLDARKDTAPHSAFTESTGVQKTWFKGQHPAGNVGIQIHHVAPINSGDRVWTLSVQDVITIGHLFLTGQYDASRVVALTGSELQNPSYVRTFQGASVADLLKDNIKEGKNRIVSGDPLSGKQIGSDDFLSFKDDQVTVIKEGDKYEMFGWLLPTSLRPSISGTFPNFLFPNYKFEAETNTHGEKRAFVVSGQYESVLPMNIHAQSLMKAIVNKDFEQMDGLGITELTEEDVALCEFVCTSKNPLQSILREGLEMVKEQS